MLKRKVGEPVGWDRWEATSNQCSERYTRCAGSCDKYVNWAGKVDARKEDRNTKGHGAGWPSWKETSNHSSEKYTRPADICESSGTWVKKENNSTEKQASKAAERSTLDIVTNQSCVKYTNPVGAGEKFVNSDRKKDSITRVKAQDPDGWPRLEFSSNQNCGKLSWLTSPCENSVPWVRKMDDIIENDNIKAHAGVATKWPRSEIVSNQRCEKRSAGLCENSVARREDVRNKDVNNTWLGVDAVSWHRWEIDNNQTSEKCTWPAGTCENLSILDRKEDANMKGKAVKVTICPKWETGNQRIEKGKAVEDTIWPRWETASNQKLEKGKAVSWPRWEIYNNQSSEKCTCPAGTCENFAILDRKDDVNMKGKAVEATICLKWEMSNQRIEKGKAMEDTIWPRWETASNQKLEKGKATTWPRWESASNQKVEKEKAIWPRWEAASNQRSEKGKATIWPKWETASNPRLEKYIKIASTCENSSDTMACNKDWNEPKGAFCKYNLDGWRQSSSCIDMVDRSNLSKPAYRDSLADGNGFQVTNGLGGWPRANFKATRKCSSLQNRNDCWKKPQVWAKRARNDSGDVQTKRETAKGGDVWRKTTSNFDNVNKEGLKKSGLEPSKDHNVKRENDGWPSWPGTVHNKTGQIPKNVIRQSSESSTLADNDFLKKNGSMNPDFDQRCDPWLQEKFHENHSRGLTTSNGDDFSKENDSMNLGAYRTDDPWVQPKCKQNKSVNFYASNGDWFDRDQSPNLHQISNCPLKPNSSIVQPTKVGCRNSGWSADAGAQGKNPIRKKRKRRGAKHFIDHNLMKQPKFKWGQNIKVGWHQSSKSIKSEDGDFLLGINGRVTDNNQSDFPRMKCRAKMAQKGRNNFKKKIKSSHGDPNELSQSKHTPNLGATKLFRPKSRFKHCIDDMEGQCSNRNINEFRDRKKARFVGHDWRENFKDPCIEMDDHSQDKQSHRNESHADGPKENKCSHYDSFVDGGSMRNKPKETRHDKISSVSYFARRADSSNNSKEEGDQLQKEFHSISHFILQNKSSGNKCNHKITDTASSWNCLNVCKSHVYQPTKSLGSSTGCPIDPTTSLPNESDHIMLVSPQHSSKPNDTHNYFSEGSSSSKLSNKFQSGSIEQKASLTVAAGTENLNRNGHSVKNLHDGKPETMWTTRNCMPSKIFHEEMNYQSTSSTACNSGAMNVGANVVIDSSKHEDPMEDNREACIGVDDNGIRMLKFRLAEFVKEILKPYWKEGCLSKEAHKIVVKKVVDKVISVLGINIPQTQERIELYMSYSKEKLKKLTQDYLKMFINT